MGHDGMDAVLHAIRHYLAGHPTASDTVEGVRLWWLAPLGVDAAYEAVAAALEELARAGAVEKRRLADGTAVYAARPPARG